MKRFVFLGGALALLVAAAPIPSTPDLGKAEGQCRPGENGPAFLVDLIGLKDRAGRVKVEVYPANDADFLADDNVLVMAGKTFRRVEVAVPAEPTPRVCIRLPGPGTYAVTVLHDRNADRKFSLSHDGIGFSGNPRLGWSKPKANAVAVNAGGSLTTLRVVMNYRTGLFSFGPLKRS
ncbi:hypothetical protein NSE01_16670 [Novosphingobium sediminis]|uniref:DUF2141 domain-containing protein n=1 Tax=Novosphingobium sediminis TaxID=707214 RepID=A0A512AJG9_9SPHN|nr:DUF2141 domain-containing protein [Novosphingobium sediminis]GEN99834.1 hypothetical protein NSE01_16670 [Novosphingobium sediminis]